ncbi:MAG: MFS transporter [Anaerolineales bacterium]|jgi:MFS family permease
MTTQENFVRPTMSTIRQLLLSFFWFSTNMMWSAILIITMPSQIKAAVGDASKGSALGLALGAGAFISMIAAPVFGALSDRIHLPGGRRKPWIVIGSVGNAIGLVGLTYLIQPGHPESVVGWAVVFLFVELFNNVATGPYSALIPDLVPAAQRGSASGWMGLMTMLGTFGGGVMGFLIGPLGFAGIYFILIGVILLGAIVTIFGVKEYETPREVPPFKLGEFLKGLYEPLYIRILPGFFSPACSSPWASTRCRNSFNIKWEMSLGHLISWLDLGRLPIRLNRRFPFSYRRYYWVQLSPHW